MMAGHCWGKCGKTYERCLKDHGLSPAQEANNLKDLASSFPFIRGLNDLCGDTWRVLDFSRED